MKRTTVISVVAAFALLAASGVQAATVEQNTVATTDGAIVNLTLSNPNSDTDAAYAVLLNYSQGTADVSVDRSLAEYQGGFDIGQAAFCNQGALQCQGANGANVFSPDQVIPESVTTVTITGLSAGDVINFSAENTPGATAIDFPQPWSVTVIPEPTTAGLLALGLSGLGLVGRRRRLA